MTSLAEVQLKLGHAEAAFVRRMPRRHSDRTARAIDLGVGLARLSRPIAFVSGFWRSGTTWMQELLANSLAAKTVFEPLSPDNPRRHLQLTAAGMMDETLRQAFIPGRADMGDPIWHYLDAAFVGVANSRVSVTCRHGIWESLRRPIVVKDVRLQANLAGVHARYDIPVIHVRRHPCGVVSSLLAARWHWSFGDISLRDIAPPLMDLLAIDDRRQRSILRDFDTDAVSRIAAFWALTERLAEQALVGKPWASIVAYEQAVAAPRQAIVDACKLAGRSPVRMEVADRDSATTIVSARGTDARLRTVAWRSRLSAAEIGRIFEIVGDICPELSEAAREGVGVQ